MTGVPGAIFSAWHNISGAGLAYLYVNYLNKRFDSDYQADDEQASSSVLSAAHK